MSVVTKKDVLDAFYGPRCKKCRKARTLNPSRTCSPCLGARLCPRCGGLGWLTSRATGYPTGCSSCSGSGKRNA